MYRRMPPAGMQRRSPNLRRSDDPFSDGRQLGRLLGYGTEVVGCDWNAQVIYAFVGVQKAHPPSRAGR